MGHLNKGAVLILFFLILFFLILCFLTFLVFSCFLIFLFSDLRIFWFLFSGFLIFARFVIPSSVPFDLPFFHFSPSRSVPSLFPTLPSSLPFLFPFPSSLPFLPSAHSTSRSDICAKTVQGQWVYGCFPSFRYHHHNNQPPPSTTTITATTMTNTTTVNDHHH